MFCLLLSTDPEPPNPKMTKIIAISRNEIIHKTKKEFTVFQYVQMYIISLLKLCK